MPLILVFLSCPTRTSYKSLANDWQEHLPINTTLLRFNLSSGNLVHSNAVSIVFVHSIAFINLS